VAANQGASMAHYPPFSWPGGSMVVDYDGRVLAQADAGPGEKVVVAPIDIDALRHERERRSGHDMRAHLRAGMYPYLEAERLPPAGTQPLTREAIGNRIRQGKQRLP
jgi:formamidase